MSWENILKVDKCSYCNISSDETGVHHTTCEGGCGKKICDSCRMKLLGKEWMIVDYEPDNDNSDLGDSCKECFEAGRHPFGRLTPAENIDGLFYEVGDK